ncbi:hypothetical protein ACFPL7_19865 [Dongia soli]|uniref:Lipoprotein n=1 Tax=Dongia soli TaxID=600628 RepID=A0ABU5E6D5_9PROT|nr:hypothetical protein [Dongia soli]MDY0881847.1 hypothetical protein [Dongia soli]
MKAKIAALVGVTALATAGCAGHNDPAPGQKAKIGQTAMTFFQNYYNPDIGSTRPGAFAVSRSGDWAAYSYCEELICTRGTSYGQRAIQLCEKHGEPCYLFAIGRDIRVDYEIVD